MLWLAAISALAMGIWAIFTFWWNNRQADETREREEQGNEIARQRIEADKQQADRQTAARDVA